jgi:hypothetical protein
MKELRQKGHNRSKKYHFRNGEGEEISFLDKNIHPGIMSAKLNDVCLPI